MLVGPVLSLPNVEISEGHRLYTGYKVLRAHPQSDQQRAALLQLEDGELGTVWRCAFKSVSWDLGSSFV